MLDESLIFNDNTLNALSMIPSVYDKQQCRYLLTRFQINPASNHLINIVSDYNNDKLLRIFGVTVL